jgi:hypothetical protein
MDLELSGTKSNSASDIFLLKVYSDIFEVILKKTTEDEGDFADGTHVKRSKTTQTDTKSLLSVLLLSTVDMAKNLGSLLFKLESRLESATKSMTRIIKNLVNS